VTALGRGADVRRIESGLVAPHSPLDLFHQFNFLDPRILKQTSWWGFRARYAVIEKVCVLPRAVRLEMEKAGRRPPTVNMVVCYRHEDELRDMIAPHSYRKELRDCQDAPPPRYEYREVELTDEQRRVYRELVKNACAEIDSGAHLSATMAMTRITRLHQLICGHVVDEEGKTHEVPERRTAALLDVLEDYGGKAVVWCAYDPSVRRVIARLKKEYGEGSTAGFWGGNLATREEEERRFKGDPACRFMVATAAAGSRGREWSCADLTVYHSNTPNLEHRDQSEARVEAMGKVDPRLCIDLRAPGTVDDRIIKNLRDKIDMAATLQGDGYRDWLTIP
jgi:hypothetical protein